MKLCLAALGFFFLAVNCDDSRDGLPLLAQCSSNDECFSGGLCTGRVGKQKKCRFCARKKQVCDSHGDCCQSPSGRYCHPVEKVCKRQPHKSLEFGQCPAGTAFSSISDKGTPLSVYHPHDTYAPYYSDDPVNYVPPPFAEAVDLPFEFPWFGTTVNRTYVTYCGALGMVYVDGSPQYANRAGLPGGPIRPGGTTGQAVPRVSVIGSEMWNGPVYVQQFSNSITISWEDAGFLSCPKACSPYGTLNAQVTLFNDGRVVLCWGDVVGGNSFYSSREFVYAGIEDDSLGFTKPAVLFPNNLFDEAGEFVILASNKESIANQCACFG